MKIIEIKLNIGIPNLDLKLTFGLQVEYFKNEIFKKVEWIVKSDFILKMKCKCYKQMIFDILKTKIKQNGEKCLKTKMHALRDMGLFGEKWHFENVILKMKWKWKWRF